MYACMQEQACIQSLHTVLALARSASGSSCVYPCNKGSLLPASCVYISKSVTTVALCATTLAGMLFEEASTREYTAVLEQLYHQNNPIHADSYRKSCKKFRKLKPHKL